jgi:hypothetical protein
MNAKQAEQKLRAALRAKAFIKHTEPKADRDEIETRISVVQTGDSRFWVATLQPNKTGKPTTAEILNGPRRGGRPILVTSAEENPGD